MTNNESVFQVVLVAIFAVCCYLVYWLGDTFGLAGIWRWIVAVIGGSLLTIVVVAAIFWLMFKLKK